MSDNESGSPVVAKKRGRPAAAKKEVSTVYKNMHVCMAIGFKIFPRVLLTEIVCLVMIANNCAQVVEKKSKSSPVKASESNGSPAKRGRGRPKKGTPKVSAAKKATPAKSSPGRARGRPGKAAAKKEESEPEESDEAADETEEVQSD